MELKGLLRHAGFGEARWPVWALDDYVPALLKATVIGEENLDAPKEVSGDGYAKLIWSGTDDSYKAANGYAAGDIIHVQLVNPDGAAAVDQNGWQIAPAALPVDWGVEMRHRVRDPAWIDVRRQNALEQAAAQERLEAEAAIQQQIEDEEQLRRQAARMVAELVRINREHANQQGD
jgi:hypothetical protein